MLDEIRPALGGNTAIEVISIVEENNLPTTIGRWSHTVAFNVAPTQPLIDADKLQALMMSLAPVEPTDVEKFRIDGDKMDLGVLYFDEIIGEVYVAQIHDFTITSTDFNPGELFRDGKLSKDLSRRVQLWRRTTIRLYPSVGYAQRVKDGDMPIGGEYWAALHELKRPRRLFVR